MVLTASLCKTPRKEKEIVESKGEIEYLTGVHISVREPMGLVSTYD